MRTHYHVAKLQEIINNLGELLGISILVLDSEAHELVHYSNSQDYCTTMQSTPEFLKKCRSCDLEILKKCTQSSKIETHYCHAGLCDVAMPITKDGIVAAYVILGRIRTSQSPKKSDNTKLYSKLTFFTDRQLENLTKLLPYIIFDGAITFESTSVLDEITEYILTHLNTNLSIKSLCTLFFVSKNALYEMFAKEYNCTVKEFILKSRIREAESKLRCTDGKITRIAEEVGFGNYAGFCKSFKKYIGISPSEYRKSHKT